MNAFVLILKSIAAGLAIGVGGFLFCGSKWLTKYVKSPDITEVGSAVGSIAFSVGLLTVCKFKLMLFTGKCGLMFEAKQNCEYWTSLFVMLLFNIAAAYGLGWAVNLLIKHDDRFLLIAQTLATNKSKLTSLNDYVKLVIQALFCGSCVHLGVKCFAFFEGGVKGTICIIWFVFMFVYSGFQHCIANSFYFGLAHVYSRDAIISVCVEIVGNWFGTIVVSLFSSKFRRLSYSSSYSSSSSSTYTEDTIDFSRRKNNREENMV